MSYPRIAVLFGIVLSVIIFAISTALYSRGSLSDQNSSKLDSFGGHTPGYPTLQTTGDVLDPTSFVINPKTAVVEPMKYLREFNYGKLSASSNGTVIRDFTIIASDQQTKEVSPGVFYNVWTFNGTIPGPTLRATEGDTIRITLMNNGSTQYTFMAYTLPKWMESLKELHLGANSLMNLLQNRLEYSHTIVICSHSRNT